MKHIKKIIDKITRQRSPAPVQEKSRMKQLAEDLSEERRYEVFPRHRVTRPRGSQK